MTDSFLIKHITWSDFQFTTPILLQDANGPCPLIALVNTILLQHEHNSQKQPEDPKLPHIAQFREHLLKKNGNQIALADLLALIGNLLVELAKYDQYSADFVPKVFDLLPRLHTGLDVDPNLINGSFPATDLATELFTRVFGLQFRHAWVLDEDIEIIRQLQTFDRLQDFLLESDNSGTHSDEATMVKNWLDTKKSQITEVGIEKLVETLAANEFAIFFRNNHFNTLIKDPEGKLYLLITASAFSSKKDLIWQGLLSTNGSEDIFFTGNFFPILDDDLVDIEDQEAVDNEDFNLVKQLQEEEDLRMAQQLHLLYQKPKKGQKLKRDKQKDLKDRLNDQGDQADTGVAETTANGKKKRGNCVIT